MALPQLEIRRLAAPLRQQVLERLREAIISAVSPPGNVVCGSAPASNSRSTIASLPFWHAIDRGATP